MLAELKEHGEEIPLYPPFPKGDKGGFEVGQRGI
jgi:hypothetical protein